MRACTLHSLPGPVCGKLEEASTRMRNARGVRYSPRAWCAVAPGASEEWMGAAVGHGVQHTPSLVVSFAGGKTRGKTAWECVGFCICKSCSQTNGFANPPPNKQTAATRTHRSRGIAAHVHKLCRARIEGLPEHTLHPAHHSFGDGLSATSPRVRTARSTSYSN